MSPLVPLIESFGGAAVAIFDEVLRWSQSLEMTGYLKTIPCNGRSTGVFGSGRTGPFKDVIVPYLDLYEILGRISW